MTALNNNMTASADKMCVIVNPLIVFAILYLSIANGPFKTTKVIDFIYLHFLRCNLCTCENHLIDR